jgi:hypothetical protein
MMHLFFNDPRAPYVTRHRRITRPTIAGLVVGGVGVAALGVLVGGAAYDQSGSSAGNGADGSMALPVATPRVGVVRGEGPLAMGTVPAAPAPVLELHEERSPAVPNGEKSRNNTVSRIESASAAPRSSVTAVPSVDPTSTINPTWAPTDEPPTAEPPTSEPPSSEPPTEPTPTTTTPSISDPDANNPGTDEPNLGGEPANDDRTANEPRWDGDGQGGKHRWDHRSWRPFWDGR